MPDFSEAEKKIFTMRRGDMVIHLDPLALRRRLLQASGGRFSQLVTASREREAGAGEESPTEVLARCDAQDKLLAVVRQAFVLPAWDEGSPAKGALDADCWRALNLYFGWLEKNAKKAGS